MKKNIVIKFIPHIKLHMEPSEYIKNITSKSVSEECMKHRCTHCQQAEYYLSDSVFFNDGNYTIDELIEFRKNGFLIINKIHCGCYKTHNSKIP
jgi:hypothetical protein